MLIKVAFFPVHAGKMISIMEILKNYSKGGSVIILHSRINAIAVVL